MITVNNMTQAALNIAQGENSLSKKYGHLSKDTLGQPSTNVVKPAGDKSKVPVNIIKLGWKLVA